MWTCVKCHSKVDASYDVCWSCGTSCDGEEDPDFVRADDFVPSDDPPVDSIPSGGDELARGVAEWPEVELVECYWAENPIEAKFLADQLGQAGILAVSDTHDLRVVFAGFFGLVPAGPYFGPRVRVGAQDLHLARAWLGSYDRYHAKHNHGE
jgi:hypothetical protein